MTKGHKFCRLTQGDEVINTCIISPQCMSESGVVQFFIQNCQKIDVLEYRDVGTEVEWSEYRGVGPLGCRNIE